MNPLHARGAMVLAGILAFSPASSARAQSAPPCFATLSAPLLVPLEGWHSEIVIDDDCRRVYLTNTDSNVVEIYSLTARAMQRPVPVGSNPTGLDTADGRTLYVANHGGSNLSLVDLVSRQEEKLLVEPRPGRSDTPRSLAIAADGRVMLATGFSGSGAGARMVELDPASRSLTTRTDYGFGGSADADTYVSASASRTAIATISGDSYPAPVFRYSLEDDLFSPVRRIGGGLVYVAMNADGSRLVTGPQVFVLDEDLSELGRIDGSGFGVAVDPVGTVGYQVTNAGSIDVLDLESFSRTSSIALPDTTGGASRFRHGTGQVAISRDGTLLAVITDHGLSLVQAPGTGGDRFASMSAQGKLVISGGDGDDSFEVQGSIELSAAGNGVHPLVEDVVLQVGASTTVIPAGSMRQRGRKTVFVGDIGTSGVELKLRTDGAGRIHYSAQCKRTELSGSDMPFHVGLAIGDDRGMAVLESGTVQVRSLRGGGVR